VNRQEVLGELQEKFAADIVELADRSPRRVYVEIRPDALSRMAAYLFRDRGARFNIATGLDTRSHLEILYHFSIESIDLLVSLRVKLDRERPSIQSITGVIRGADWIEREISEMLGVEFRGHPNPKRLLLSEEWPEGVYPHRRDYAEWDPEAIRDRGV